MSRIIKISFQDHPIVASNSEPRRDFVRLQLDFFFLNEIVQEAAVVIEGTQNAINGISDDIPLLISGENIRFTQSNPEGVVAVAINFDFDADLYETHAIRVILIDHLGWKNVEEVVCPTNLILTEAGQPIINENGQPLFFIKPTA